MVFVKSILVGLFSLIVVEILLLLTITVNNYYASGNPKWALTLFQWRGPLLKFGS